MRVTNVFTYVALERFWGGRLIESVLLRMLSGNRSIRRAWGSEPLEMKGSLRSCPCSALFKNDTAQRVVQGPWCVPSATPLCPPLLSPRDPQRLSLKDHDSRYSFRPRDLLGARRALQPLRRSLSCLMPDPSSHSSDTEAVGQR